MLSSESEILRLLGRVVKRERAKWRLHPLIHTLLEINLAQYIEKTTKLCEIIDAGAICNLQCDGR